MSRKVIFINSHPIQYFAPLYKYMNASGLQTACWYCSDETLKGGLDQEFGINVKWDIPLLEGYEHRFFKNYAPKPSFNNGYFGLMNFGMVRELFRIPKSVIVVHGYHFFTHTLILTVAKLKGHTICLRFEAPHNQEVLKTGFKHKIKQAGLKYCLFPGIKYFLYIGEQNRLFYKSYNIADAQLVACPYAVDNIRFQQEWKLLSAKTSLLKQGVGIPNAGKVIVFSAKYIEKKRPLDILQAFKQLQNNQVWLIMVGEGELRPQMESYISSHSLHNVILTGFVNQSKIAEYYAISDVFVMCSGAGETWGLSANEAMNFNLPLIISDMPGSATDLIIEGVNGYTFKTGDIAGLADKLTKVLIDNALTRTVSSIDIVNKYSYDTIVKNISVVTE